MSIACYLSIVIAASMPLAVAAQAPSSVDAADADAAVMPYAYRSAFESYRHMVDGGDAPGSLWRAANEEVGRIGGHAGIMRSAQDPSASATDFKDGPAEWAPVTPHSTHGGHHGSHH